MLGDPARAAAILEKKGDMKYSTWENGFIVEAPVKETIADINALLVQNGIPVVGLAEVTADLEEVFVQITKRGEEAHENG